MSGALVMAVIAVALAIGAAAVALGKRNPYAKRITATMLGAAAILLGAYAFALHGWDTGR